MGALGVGAGDVLDVLPLYTRKKKKFVAHIKRVQSRRLIITQQLARYNIKK